MVRILNVYKANKEGKINARLNISSNETQSSFCHTFFCCVFFIFFQISCEDNGVSPRDVSDEKWYGQVVSEFVYEVLKPDGSVWTWGVNYAGTLGNGTSENRNTPGRVLYLNNIVSIDQSWGAAVAVDKNGNIWFWGNSMLYLGPPNIDTNVTAPIKIAHLDGIKSITITAVHIFLLKNDGTTWYIRLDWYTPKIVDGPRQIEGITNVISIQKELGLTVDGKIYDLFSREILLNTLRDIIAVSGSRNRHVIVLKKDGTVWGWGSNDLGQLGNETFLSSDIPTKVINCTDIVAISANYDYNLALKKDGTVWFWGFAGRKGDTLVVLNTPVKIEGLEDIVLIYAGPNCLVMKADRTYWTFSVDDRIPRQVQFN